MITTWWPESSPIRSLASATATLGMLSCSWPIAVSERTRLPVWSAAVNSRLVSTPVVSWASAAS